MVVTVKDEGSLVGRGFFRVGAHAVGKIEQAVEVRQLFLFQQPVYIGEHRPEVGTAEAPELQPGNQLMQLVQTGQPLHALHLGIALDEIDLYPLREGAALRRHHPEREGADGHSRRCRGSQLPCFQYGSQKVELL